MSTIFEQLNVADHLRLQLTRRSLFAMILTCRQWHRIYSPCLWQHRHERHSIGEGFKTYGQHTERLNFDPMFGIGAGEITDALLPFGTNIQHLQLLNMHVFTTSMVRDMLLSLQNLRSLVMQHSTLKESSLEKYLENLAKFAPPMLNEIRFEFPHGSQLREDSLVRFVTTDCSSQIENLHLGRFHATPAPNNDSVRPDNNRRKNEYLRLLALTECTLSNETLLSLIGAVPNLTQIQLPRGNSVTDSTVQGLIDHCPKLDSVTLAGCTRISPASIKRLMRMDVSILGSDSKSHNAWKLKTLDLSELWLTDDTLEILAKYQGHSLEDLNLNGCQGITANAINEHILGGMHTLKSLGLEHRQNKAMCQLFRGSDSQLDGALKTNDASYPQGLLPDRVPENKSGWACANTLKRLNMRCIQVVEPEYAPRSHTCRDFWQSRFGFTDLKRLCELKMTWHLEHDEPSLVAKDQILLDSPDGVHWDVMSTEEKDQYYKIATTMYRTLIDQQESKPESKLGPNLKIVKLNVEVNMGKVPASYPLAWTILSKFPYLRYIDLQEWVWPKTEIQLLEYAEVVVNKQ